MSGKPLRLFAGALIVVSLSTSDANGQLPSLGESVVANEITVTLLEVRRLSEDEYFEATGAPPPDWGGGGVRLVVLVENRPGVPAAPVLDDIRVAIGSKPYNAVTKPTSDDPFAPDVMIHAFDRFFDGSHARHTRRPLPRSGSTASVLDIFIRGGRIPAGATGTVELAHGAASFRFRLPAIR